jgi:hypothetical protein
MDIIRIGEAADKAVRVLEGNDRALYASLSNLHFIVDKLLTTTRTTAGGSNLGIAFSNIITASNLAVSPLPR